MSSVVLHSLPGYSMHSNMKHYTPALQTALEAGELPAFVEEWRGLWFLGGPWKPESVAQVDARIVSGDSEEAEACLRRSFTKSGEVNMLCGHDDLCPGMEIRMPWTLVKAALISRQYGVPVGAALHQAFCEGPHDKCFDYES